MLSQTTLNSVESALDFQTDKLTHTQYCSCQNCCGQSKSRKRISNTGKGPLRLPKFSPQSEAIAPLVDGKTAPNVTRSEFKTFGDSSPGGTNRLKWSQPNGKGSAITVTYAFANDLNIPGLSSSEAKTLFTKALQVWADFAPLNFQEVADPGDGRAVDIRVNDDFIDGNPGGNNILAFAYSPSYGDITFDSGNQWNTALYLETAVHELGHALGLDHDNSVDAIMNSSIQNRYSAGSNPFLLKDDIAGIQNIYGTGKGSVRQLGAPAPQPTPQPTPPSEPQPAPPVPEPPSNPNLVENGSFENVPVNDNSFVVYSQFAGWFTTGGIGIQVDKRTGLGAAADGKAWVELDSYGNSAMAQNVNTDSGKNYKLSFEYSPRQNYAADTNGIEVYWNGQRLDTITQGGKGQNAWQNFEYDVQGAGGDATRLEFRAVGTSDNVGGFIDDVVVTEANAALQGGQSLGASQLKEEAFLKMDTAIGHNTGLLVASSISL